MVDVVSAAFLFEVIRNDCSANCICTFLGLFSKLGKTPQMYYTAILFEK